MMNLGVAELILMPFFSLLPIVVLYFVIKMAVKNAIRELKEEGRL
jgi:hypothetical protein